MPGDGTGRGVKKTPRRALTQARSAGPSETWGDPALAKRLATALNVGDADPRRGVHGFHSYPARMHPLREYNGDKLIVAYDPDLHRALQQHITVLNAHPSRPGLDNDATRRMAASTLTTPEG